MPHDLLDRCLEVATGKVIGQTPGRHRNEEFRRILNLIDREVPAA